MRGRRKENAETAAALAELDAIRDRLAAVRSEFHYSADPLLVEADIFEIRALNARYGYLLRRLKQQGAALPYDGGAGKKERGDKP